MAGVAPQDAYNALVCTAIAPEIGQRRVLQLALGGEAEENPRAIARPRRGDVAFDNEADFEKLWRNLVKGWIFSMTRTSETYSYEDFRRDKPVDGIEVLIMNEDKDVEFHSSQHTGARGGRYHRLFCARRESAIFQSC